MGERDEELEVMVDNIDDAKPEVEGEEPIVKETKEKAKAYIITEEMMEQEKERIKGLNFLAITQYRREINHQITDLEDTKMMIETLQRLSKPKNDEDSLGYDIALANLKSLIDISTQEEMNEFLENFDQNVMNLNKTLEFVTEREEELKDIPKTATYMNKCMLEVLDQKTTPLKDRKEKRLKPIKIFYSNIRTVCENRDSMDFLRGQVEPNITYVRRILNDLKKERKNGRDGKNLTNAIMENVQKTFCNVFKIEQMRVFELYLKKMIGKRYKDTDLISFLYQYLLYIIYVNEKSRKKGNHKWVEALIMNVLDIESEHYDLPKDKDDLNEEIFAMIGDMVNSLHL